MQEDPEEELEVVSVLPDLEGYHSCNQFLRNELKVGTELVKPDHQEVEELPVRLEEFSPEEVEVDPSNNEQDLRVKQLRRSLWLHQLLK